MKHDAKGNRRARHDRDTRRFRVVRLEERIAPKFKPGWCKKHPECCENPSGCCI